MGHSCEKYLRILDTITIKEIRGDEYIEVGAVCGYSESSPSEKYDERMHGSSCGRDASVLFEANKEHECEECGEELREQDIEDKNITEDYSSVEYQCNNCGSYKEIEYEKVETNLN